MPYRRSTYNSRRSLTGGHLALLLIALAVVVAVLTFPRNGDAAHIARHKAGFTSVTHVHRSWFNACHKDYVGYDVTGIRNGQIAHVEVCATWPKFFSYVR